MTDRAPTAEEQESLKSRGGGTDVLPTAESPTIGWPQAIAFGLAVVVIGFLGAVVGSNAILTKSLALTRAAREWLATALFFVVLVILAAALRWLQQRGLI
jgi:hypothetical protein